MLLILKRKPRSKIGECIFQITKNHHKRGIRSRGDFKVGFTTRSNFHFEKNRKQLNVSRLSLDAFMITWPLP